MRPGRPGGEAEHERGRQGAERPVERALPGLEREKEEKREGHASGSGRGGGVKGGAAQRRGSRESAPAGAADEAGDWMVGATAGEERRERGERGLDTPSPAVRAPQG